MPVGCLGVSGSAADSTLYLSSEASREASKEVERIELMQSRLLIQIFRVGERLEGEEPLSCTVCRPHTGLCCQAVPGLQVMADLVRANTEAVWNMALVKAVNTLSYQVRLITVCWRKEGFLPGCQRHVSLDSCDVSCCCRDTSVPATSSP